MSLKSALSQSSLRSICIAKTSGVHTYVHTHSLMYTNTHTHTHMYILSSLLVSESLDGFTVNRTFFPPGSAPPSQDAGGDRNLKDNASWEEWIERGLAEAVC